MADTAAADAPAPAPTRPTKPDEALYRENLEKATKELDQVMAKLNAAKQNIEFASNRNSESPTALRRKELLDEKNEIKAKQNAGKNSRSSKINEIKRLEAQIKTLEHKYDYVEEPLEKARDTMNLGPKGKRSLEERLDDAVRILQARCDSGTLRFAEQRETETKIVQFNTALEKKKEQQKPIDDLQAKIKEIKDSMDDPESKALNERWAAIQAELDTIHAEQAEAGKNLDSLHTERKELQTLQREKFAAKKNLGDEYYKQRNAWRDYDREQRAKAQERYRAEQERIRKERKLERAQKMLAEASDPAYLDEIRRANSLLQYFDPSFVPEKAPLQPTTNLQAQAERKVDASDLQGVKIMSKKDREEELFPAQKKGKKGKKGKKQDAAAAKTFNCPPSVLEDCSYLDIDPPMSAEEVPGVIEKVKSKLDNWKADQAAQTQKNIEKAKKEIEKIEAEEANERDGKKSPSGPATPNGNGAASKEVESDDKIEDAPKDAPEEVTEAVEKVSLEDNKEEEKAEAAA